MNIDEVQLKKILSAINETTIEGGTGSDSGAIGVATSDERIPFTTMYQQTAIPSIARNALAEAPLNGPTGAVFNICNKEDGSGIKLTRGDVEVFPSKPIKTSITQESLQDIENVYGADGVRAVATMLQGVAVTEENEKFIEFLDTNAVQDSEPFKLVGTNALEAYHELTMRVASTVLKMNLKGVKTFRASVVVPYQLASGVMGFDKGVTLPTTSSFYIGGTQLHDFYVNPDPTSTKVFVILHDKYDGSKSGGVFAPYQNFIDLAQDPDTGEHVYFIYNRFALAKSPLHTVDKPSIMKFDFITK